MFHSKLTSKNQTTIPKEVREILKLKAGDQVTFEIGPNNTVVIKKNQALDLAYAKALTKTLNEWESKEDEEAYRDL